MKSKRKKDNNDSVIGNNIKSTHSVQNRHNLGNDNIVNVNKDKFVRLLLLKIKDCVNKKQMTFKDVL